MEEKREWGAAALCHRERDTEKQPWSIRLNIDKHAATITATLGTRKKMNSVCVQSFLYASEDKPLRPWMKKRNTTSHRQKDIGVKGMFPEKTLWNLCKRELKNHGEQRIDSKLILNCSVITEVSRLCLSGLNAAADMYRAFSSFFSLFRECWPTFPWPWWSQLLSGSLVIPAWGAQRFWENGDGSPKNPTVRTDQRQSHTSRAAWSPGSATSPAGGAGPRHIREDRTLHSPCVGQQPEKDWARQDRGSSTRRQSHFAASS